MSDFSQFLLAVERRARRIQGIISGSTTLLASAGVMLFAAASFRVLDDRPLSNGWIVLVAVPIFLAMIACLIARKRGPRIPLLLLRLDLALALPARLSSLYELRVQGKRSVFRRRLEAALDPFPHRWRRGLPVPKRAMVAIVAGTVCLAGAVIVSLLPPSEVREVSLVLPPGVAERTIAEEDTTAAGQSVPPPAVTEIMESPAPTDVPSNGTPTQPFQLEDVLSELSGLDSAQAVLGSTPSGELDRLIEERRQAMEQLSELLGSILERIQQEGGTLTPQESQNLRQYAGAALAPEVVQTLKELTGEIDPDRVEEMLSSLLASFGAPLDPGKEDRTTSRAARSEADESSIPDEEASSTDSIVSAGRSQQDEPSSSAASSQLGRNDADPERTVLEDEGASDPFGGDEGASSQDDTEQWASKPPGFIPEAPPASIGEKGGFRDLITEGVPIERPSDVSAPTSYTVDFERIQSILESRSISDDVLDIVRKYFELITEGGS